ncbi:MAG: head-tail adaptor protein [Pseudomonadota bacterium]
MSDVIDPGRLRTRMILEQPDDEDDGAGGATRDWVTVTEFWAELRPVSLRAGTAQASMEQRITHELIYRAGPDLTRALRLKFGERLFNILAVADLNNDGTFRKALIEEIKA